MRAALTTPHIWGSLEVGPILISRMKAFSSLRRDENLIPDHAAGLPAQLKDRGSHLGDQDQRAEYRLATKSGNPGKYIIRGLRGYYNDID